MKTLLSLLLENEAGAICRVTDLLCGRGFEMAGLNISPTPDPTLLRVTIVVGAKDEAALDQVAKQLDKLIDVIKVTTMETGAFVAREMALMKIRSSHDLQPKVLKDAETFGARIVHTTPDACILEATGDEEKIDAFHEFFNSYGIIEATRTGRIAVSSKSERPIKDGCRVERQLDS